MKKNVWTVLGIVLAILFAVIAIVSKVKGGCTSMIECTSGSVPMKCHWTYVATTVVGIAGCVAALLAAFAKTCEGRRFTVLASAVVAIATIVIVSPAGIGTCAHADSLCNGTATIVYVLAAIAIILALVMAAKADPESVNKPKAHL